MTVMPVLVVKRGYHRRIAQLYPYVIRFFSLSVHCGNGKIASVHYIEVGLRHIKPRKPPKYPYENGYKGYKIRNHVEENHAYNGCHCQIKEYHQYPAQPVLTFNLFTYHVFGVSAVLKGIVRFCCNIRTRALLLSEISHCH